MSENGQSRSAVVATARTWIGTPYHHMADLKGIGVDCAMILVRIFCDSGLVEPFDPRPYTRDWMLHRNEERYLGFLLQRTHEVAVPDMGDIALFRVGRCYAHGAIVTKSDPLHILHAFAGVGCVIEEELSRNVDLGARLSTTRFFSHWRK